MALASPSTAGGGLEEEPEYPYRSVAPGLDRAGAGGLGDSRAGRVAVVLDRVGHALGFGMDPPRAARALRLKSDWSLLSVWRSPPHSSFGTAAMTIARWLVSRFRRLMLALRTESTA